MEKEVKEKLYRNPISGGKFRNAPCICGSKVKVKNCHGTKYALSEIELKEIQAFFKGETNGDDEQKREA